MQDEEADGKAHPVSGAAHARVAWFEEMSVSCALSSRTSRNERGRKMERTGAGIQAQACAGSGVRDEGDEPAWPGAGRLSERIVVLIEQGAALTAPGLTAGDVLPDRRGFDSGMPNSLRAPALRWRHWPAGLLLAGAGLLLEVLGITLRHEET